MEVDYSQDSANIPTLNFRLNLTIASRVHILEPQWNPMMEFQAVGRVVRLGQTKLVTVYRYIMTTTVEEVIHTIFPIHSIASPFHYPLRCKVQHANVVL